MVDSLEARLKAIELTEPSTIARSRAIAAARDSSAPARVKGTRKSRYVVAALVAVGLFALTPPGASVANSVGDLVGIGDEPSNPLDLGPGPSEQAVVGLGDAAPGVPYEIATTDGALGNGGANAQETCFYVSLPTLEERTRSASCLTAAALRGLERDAVGSLFAQRAPAGLGSSADIVLTGATTDRVARLEVEYPSEDGMTSRELELAPFKATSQSADGAEMEQDRRSLSAFAAFLPLDLEPAIPLGEGNAHDLEERILAIREAARGYEQELNEITLRAYDESGAVIATISPGSISSNGMGLAILPAEAPVGTTSRSSSHGRSGLRRNDVADP